jgi:hypothetical protein
MRRRSASFGRGRHADSAGTGANPARPRHPPQVAERSPSGTPTNRAMAMPASQASQRKYWSGSVRESLPPAGPAHRHEPPSRAAPCNGYTAVREVQGPDVPRALRSYVSPATGLTLAPLQPLIQLAQFLSNVFSTGPLDSPRRPGERGFIPKRRKPSMKRPSSNQRRAALHTTTGVLAIALLLLPFQAQPQEASYSVVRTFEEVR